MRRATAVTVVALATLLPTVAHAYCRTTTCANREPKTRPPECDAKGSQVDRCYLVGEPLHWPSNCFSYSVNVNGSKRSGITAAQLEEIIDTAFANWLSGPCPGGGKPNLQIERFPRVECDQVRYNAQSPNQNLWVFHDDVWPDAATATSAIALTIVHFHTKTGVIYDVDVEFNSANFDFSLESDGPGKDLQGVVQHESGHILGLADLYVGGTTSTMYWNYGSDSGLAMRSLEPDDIAGVCKVFGSTDTPDAGCDPTPPNGFTSQCVAEPEEGCSCRQIGVRPLSKYWSWAILGLGWCLVRLRGQPR